jgi:hypothetical protein
MYAVSSVPFAFAGAFAGAFFPFFFFFFGGSSGQHQKKLSTLITGSFLAFEVLPDLPVLGISRSVTSYTPGSTSLMARRIQFGYALATVLMPATK